MTYAPQHVHLVGSIGLPSGVDVFRTCGRILGRRLQRIPDGEPGGRRLWISWQIPFLRACPFFQLATAPEQPGQIFGPLRLADGVRPQEVRFDELGYALEARASYRDFLEAKARGDLPQQVRFQVSLPTPYAVVWGQFVREALPIAFEAYTRAMLREVERICERIPHRELTIQWDVCFEMVIWDGNGNFRWNLPGDPRTEIIKHLKRISEAVPEEVELGYHLCYGDLDAKHFFDPQDASAIVELANAITAGVERPIAYIHAPVPAERTDDEFYRPFEGLKLRPGTELFLGVVHGRDGLEGLNARISAASRHVPSFGIATECGMARARTPSVVEALLELHAAGSREPAS
jgi:methionine synthase II (cobalamin-independent)